jgi:hypothetical protein
VATCYIDIRKGPKIAEAHRSSVFKYTNVRDDVKRDSL